MTSLTTGLIAHTKELLHAVRGSLIKVGENLYRIKQSNEWQQYADNWGQFVESELEISQSQASKLQNIYEHFVVKGGLDASQLEGTDYEKLNAVRKLSGSPLEQLAKAKTLSRRELKQEKGDEQPHEHEPITICGICQIRL